MNPLLQRIQSLSHPMETRPTRLPARLAKLEGIETVLFDIYGTLMASGSGDIGIAYAARSSDAMAEAFAAAGLTGKLAEAGALGPELLNQEIHTAHECARREGMDFPEVEIREIWQQVTEHLRAMELVDAPATAAQLEQLAIEYDCRVNPVWPMPGAREILRALWSRGLRLGIISNAQFYTPLAIEALLGQSVEELGFEPGLCVWSYRERRAKPSKILFESLAEKVDLRRAAYVGNDMLNDMWPASRCGCRTVLFAGDERSLRLREEDERCANLVPDAVVTHLGQLEELL